jgi:hypothetical protein
MQTPAAAVRAGIVDVLLVCLRKFLHRVKSVLSECSIVVTWCR